MIAASDRVLFTVFGELAFPVGVLFRLLRSCGASGRRSCATPPDDPQLRFMKADVRQEWSVAGDRGRGGMEDKT
jgi:hypothetical protein